MDRARDVGEAVLATVVPSGAPTRTVRVDERIPRDGDRNVDERGLREKLDVGADETEDR
ncbi:hypothetical protein [Natrinema salaciae]|uniref:hypothetical protein n=1 Tax=Natrinema salaciae TaxID=1186196 RepID=UPI001587EE02|nr:hypothetical protein [Natrinema salaciae]